MEQSTGFDSSAIPTPAQLAQAGAVPVFDAQGGSHFLRDLIKPPLGKSEGKVVAVFIRHFRCGMCMEYVTALTKNFPPERLHQADVRLIIVGCGDWVLIQPYVDLLQCPFPLYADPTKQSYAELGMTFRTLDMGKGCGEEGCGDQAGNNKGNGGYVERGLFGIIRRSILSTIKMGHYTASAGDSKQVGGEFVFQGSTCIFASRMRTTRDLAPIASLAEVLGVVPAALPASPKVKRSS